MSESAMDVVEIMARAFWGFTSFKNRETFSGSIEGMREAVRAAADAGFVIVPKDATTQMLEAGAEESEQFLTTHDAWLIWSAMIAASVKGGGT